VFTLGNPFDNFFNVQRDIERIFNQFWTDLPARTANSRSSFQVQASDDNWLIDVPIPGIDPRDVKIEVAGNTLSIRAEQSGEQDRTHLRYEQTLTIPQFLDLDKITASNRHGMLQLMIPMKESVKPRRIEIADGAGDQKPQETRKLSSTEAAA
jgi:HSP20 family protein